MRNRIILTTKDPLSGFWAASERRGYDVQLVWAMASDALATIFALRPTEVRDFLDSHAGRLLADDISFIEGGPTNAEAIEALIKARLRHLGWRRLYEQAISEIRTEKCAPKEPHWEGEGTKAVSPPTRVAPDAHWEGEGTKAVSPPTRVAPTPTGREKARRPCRPRRVSPPTPTGREKE